MARLPPAAVIAAAAWPAEQLQQGAAGGAAAQRHQGTSHPIPLPWRSLVQSNTPVCCVRRDPPVSLRFFRGRGMGQTPSKHEAVRVNKPVLRWLLAAPGISLCRSHPAKGQPSGVTVLSGRRRSLKAVL